MAPDLIRRSMTSPLSRRLPRSGPALAAAALCALVTGAVMAGHEGLRTAQVLLLALPLAVWLRWPVQSRLGRWVRGASVTAGLCLFLLDGLLRSYLTTRYQVVPDSSIVLAALANTNAREAGEYLQAQWPLMLGLAVLALTGVLLTLGLVRVCNRHQAPLGRPGRWLLLGLLLFGCVAHASKPWRRHHPALFWPQWVGDIAQLRVDWSDQAGNRATLMSQARAAAPKLSHTGPNTVVLVLSDSINRDNMSLYGYPRNTTPQLSALSRSQAGRWLTLRNAWSTEPATMASLSGLFSFGERAADAPVAGTQHLLALARAAGYKVWWISNHDDLAVKQQHALLADTVELVNRAPGRSSSQLDGELLPGLERALASREPHKLIVLHMLGAHPHYRLRSPADQRPFDDGNDAVEREMQAAGRPLWLRELRQDYDAALAYHDAVVAETLRLTLSHRPSGAQAAWMFLSDHGQEVGHELDFAGHSPGSAAGYRIPALLWRSSGEFPPALAERPLRADWAAWPLAELLGLRWAGQMPERNVLSPAYRWAPPPLPLNLVRFDR